MFRVGTFVKIVFMQAKEAQRLADENFGNSRYDRSLDKFF
jgi:hypothetical protein